MFVIKKYNYWFYLSCIKNYNFFRTNVERLAAQIASREPLISPKVLPKFIKILQKIKDLSLNETFNLEFKLHGLLKGHLLPITNISIDKYGEMYNIDYMHQIIISIIDGD